MNGNYIGTTLRTLLCFGAIMSSAAADELRNHSFGKNGLLKIHEIEDAAVYQVEWSSDLDGSWSTFGRPDLKFMPPTGNSLVTASLPMRFRVVAEVSSDYLVVDLSAGPEATEYPVTFLTEPPPEGWTDDYKTTKMAFRLIPAGTYQRGSPVDEPERFSTEYLHPVTISKPFYIGVFEVTPQQWERVMGTWPSYFSNPAYRNTRPVEKVSHAMIVGPAAGFWWPETSAVDAGSFMGRLSRKTGRIFHLPTEGEWEYAARAGSTAALTSGLNISDSQVDENLAALGRYEGNSDAGNAHPDSDLSQGTTTVGSYPPNAWGLYDIHGNVAEKVADTIGPYPEDGTALIDPRGASLNSDNYTSKGTRGGGYFQHASNCRLAYRGFTFFESGFASEGFRAVVRLYPDDQP